MAVTHVSVSNFKSFRSLEIELSQVSVLIGSNAAGKSNFIEVFRFIQAIRDFGLQNAISLQGGSQYLPNVRIGTDTPVAVSVRFAQPSGQVLTTTPDGAWLAFESTATTHSFALEFTKTGRRYAIVQDELLQEGRLVELRIKKSGMLTPGVVVADDATISVRRTKNDYDVSVSDLPDGVKVDPRDFLLRSSYGQSVALSSRMLLSERMPVVPVLAAKVYDIDPKAPKRASPITGKAELEGDASNLAIVLGSLLQSRAKKRQLTNLLSDLLPFVGGLGLETFADKSLLFKIREVYSDNKYVPASLLSDGTISLTALVVALYFEPNRVTIIEEIERNLHPAVLPRLMQLIYDAATDRQVVVSTHHPELVKHVSLSDLLLVVRDGDGYSTVARAADLDGLGQFLTSNMGVDDLYVQGVLEALSK